MRRAVLTFPAKGTGAGTQTVTGVADSDGPFIGKLFLFQSCFAVLNTLTAGAIPTGGYSDFRGIDTGAIRSLWASSEAYSGFNFKAADTGQSLGDHSLMDIWTDNFGQGEIYRTAKISAIRSGEFDLTYDGNLRTGDDIICIVLGGDDIDFTFTNYISGTYTTPTKPQGLLSLSVPSPSASGATGWGTGGQCVTHGFATRSGIYGVGSLNVVNQGSNFSQQLTNTYINSVDGFGTPSTGNPIVTAWGDTSITVSNTGAVGGVTPCVISGENIRCAGGVITAGDPTFDPGIWAKLIFFFSNGYPTSSSVQSPIGQVARGWADGTNQAGFWSGEKTPGNVAPQYGARFLSNHSVIRLGTPNGSSTTFTTVGSVTSISSSGPVLMDWSAVSASPEQILWFAIGVAAIPPVPPEVPIIGCVTALPN